MKVLLDTHIWLWSLLEPEQLSDRLLQVLKSPENELYLSPISVWEVTMLASKKRIVLNSEVRDWVTEALSRVPIIEIPLTIPAALEAEGLNLPHRDPSDRFLVATSRVFNLTLATADTRILSAGLCEVLPNN